MVPPAHAVCALRHAPALRSSNRRAASVNPRRSLLPSHRSHPPSHRSLLPSHRSLPSRISAFRPGIVLFPAGQRRRAAVLTSKKPKVDGNGGLRPIPSTFYERRFAKVDGFWRKASNPSTFRRISGHAESTPRAREQVSPRKSPKSRWKWESTPSSIDFGLKSIKKAAEERAGKPETSTLVVSQRISRREDGLSAVLSPHGRRYLKGRERHSIRAVPFPVRWVIVHTGKAYSLVRLK